MVAKLEQSKQVANHKIKILLQQQRRNASNKDADMHVVDLSNVPDVDDGKTYNDAWRHLVEISLRKKKNYDWFKKKSYFFEFGSVLFVFEIAE
jgi:hypothetical protein